MSDNLIDVYDFDGTLCKGDTIMGFWRYVLAKHPKLWRHGPAQAKSGLMRLTGRYDAAQAKSLFQRYFADIDVCAEAQAYWATPQAQRKLYLGFLASRPHDVPRIIATASAACVVAPVVAQLGMDGVIASQVDPTTGQLQGLNCRGEEKVRRLYEAYPGVTLRAMYTDDIKADAPLLELAQQKYVVRKGFLIEL